ncbi:hypothetical protein EB796_021636 [Bugula neritina]|uniref:Uncharacterized protein n=1 Tax=Bugula neritina TaxID=10212 RepID=A0A7J7J1R4_BUGNE|nr:hypothetical protein EB796_021636 [Bugula neritina]
MLCKVGKCFKIAEKHLAKEKSAILNIFPAKIMVQLLRNKTLYTTQHLVDAVNTSAVCNEAVTFPSWTWYEWDSFLSRYFRPIPNTTKVSSIKFHSDGTCTTNLGKFTLLKSVPVEMPNVLTPGGLSNERQSYLKEKVAPLMPLEYRDSISSS